MWLVYLTLMPIFREGFGHETVHTYNGMMDVHECFGPCSGSCLQVQIYCSTILLPNTFTFISPDARSITLHKDDDTVQRQQFMLPLSQCTKLNHHHFLLLHDKGQKYCFDDKYFTDDHTSCAWSPSYETFTILRFITIKFETHLHPGWKTSWMLSFKSFHFISLKLLHIFFLSLQTISNSLLVISTSPQSVVMSQCTVV